MTLSRSVIVTGGTVGLGYQAALNIAKAHPDYLVVLSSRSDSNHAADAINRALGQKNTIYIPLDLSNLSNVREYAKQWDVKSYPPIQSLLLNATLQFPGALTKTPSGLEATFAISHVGHALLFHLLHPYLAERARIVVTSSGVHDPAQKSGLPDAIYTSAEDLAHPPPSMVDVPGRQRYASSKLANVLWTYALSQRLEGRSITVTAMDPGMMPGTHLAREGNGIERFLWYRVLPRILPLLRMLVNPNIHTPAESGAALARLAMGADVEGVSGKYFEGLREIPSSKDSYVREKQDDLWQWTVNHVAQSLEEASRFNELR
jgi:NAD(P)-dependent dehydrogenase (short-subunit alcohol dehydrogenase family)